MSIIKLPPYMLDSTLDYTFHQVTSTGNLVVQGNLVFSDGTSQTTAGAGGNAGNVISNSSVYISSTGGATNWVIDTDNALTIPRLGTINFVDPEIGGFGTPSVSSRTPGTRIVLYPQVNGSTADYSIGIDGGVQWYGVPDSNARFDWYAAETQIATLSGSGTFTANGNVKAQNFLFANGVNILSTVGAGSYGNTQVAAYLAANSAIPITTLTNITTIANVIAPNFLFANGVNILSTVSGGGGSYANADVAAYLAANSAIYLGNPVTRPTLQANNTQVFVGNATTIAQGGASSLGSTFIMNNAYYNTAGVLTGRNTTAAGAGYFEIAGGTFNWAAVSSATAGSAAGMGSRMSLSSTALATQNSVGITSAGTLTVQGASGLVTTQTTGALFNTTATTINLGGAATTITTGAATANLVVGTSAGLGNVFARYLNGTLYGNTVGTTATYSGAVTVSNLTATSNITVGNLITTGTYGNITGANVISANTVIVSNIKITGTGGNTATNYPVYFDSTTNQLSRSVKPVASAYYTGTTTSFSWGAVFKPDTAELNVGGMYDSSTGAFTPTVAGWYKFTPIMWITSATAGWYVQVAKNNWPTVDGPGNVSVVYGDNTFSGSTTYNGSVMLYLNGTTDYAKVYVFAGAFNTSDTITIEGSGFFSAKLSSLICEWVSP